MFIWETMRRRELVHVLGLYNTFSLSSILPHLTCYVSTRHAAQNLNIRIATANIT